MTDNTKMKEIVSGDEEAILVELAEECCELGQAALKLMRIRCHRSPANEERTRESLIEEMADVQVMLGAAGASCAALTVAMEEMCEEDEE